MRREEEEGGEREEEGKKKGGRGRNNFATGLHKCVVSQHTGSLVLVVVLLQ